MKHVQSAGGIVLNPKGDVLIVTNEIGSRTFPKGSVEPNEDPLAAARREIQEESGLKELHLVRSLGVLVRPGFTADNPHTPSVIKHIHMFLFRTDEVTLTPKTEDVIAAEWLPSEEVTRILTRQEEAHFFTQQKF